MPSKILLYGVDVPKLNAEIPPPNPVFTAPAKADSVLYFFLFVEVLKTVLDLGVLNFPLIKTLSPKLTFICL